MVGWFWEGGVQEDVLVVVGFTPASKGLDSSSESRHTIRNFTRLVLCNRKLNVAEHKRIVQFCGFSVILRRVVEFVHNK